MRPDFGLGIGREVAGEVAGDNPPRPRPTLLVRAVEIAGLALVIYGLASYRFGLVAVGGVLILGSYALYRRRHGAQDSGRATGGPDPDGGDGGSD